MSFALRCVLLTAITIAAYAANAYTDFSSLAARPAGAQARPATATSVVTDPTPLDAAATAAPTPTPAPAEAATPADSTVTEKSPTAAASPSASATPRVPPAHLPPLTDKPDQPGASAALTIDAAGGRIASADGRAVIDVPAGASSEAMKVTVTRRLPADVLPPSPDFPLVGLWSFDAATADGTALHAFSKDLTVTLRFTPEELRGRNPESLRYWSFDDTTKTWEPAPASVESNRLTLVATVNYFGLSVATASPIVDTGPLLLGSNVGVQSGSATQSVPIETAPGRGGLTPTLNLSYDSMRVEEMRTYGALSGWVGQGWELGTGSVQIANDPTGTRFFLEGQGFGGEMMWDPIDRSRFRLRDEQYLRIESRCDDRLTAFGWDSSPRPISTRDLDGTWSSPISVAGITSYHPRVYPVTDKLWFATNDNDDRSVADTGAGARSKDGGKTWSATPAPPWGAHGGVKQIARDAGGRLWMIAHDWVTNAAYWQTEVFYSDNDGDSWIWSTTFGSGSGQPTYAGWKILPHPTDPNVIAIIGHAFGISGNHYEGFFARTTDRGTSWTSNAANVGEGMYGTTRDAVMLPTGRIVAVGSFGGPMTPIPWYVQISDDYGATVWSPWGFNGNYAGTLGPFRSADGSRVAFLFTPNAYGVPQTIDLMLSTDFGASFSAVSLDQSLDDFLGADPLDRMDFFSFDSSPSGDALYVYYAPWGSPKRILKLSPVSADFAWYDVTGNYPFTNEGHDGMSVIPQGYSEGNCPFYATDKSGTTYAYGTDDAHRRWYLEYDGFTWVRRYYRLDLAYVIDTLGNRVDYTYWQERPTLSACGTGPQCEWVMAAYPEDILYNYEGAQAQAQVHFTTASDQDNAALGRTPAVWVRTDTPYDAVCGGYTYSAPDVMETRRLTDVDVNVWDAGSSQWQRARRYTLTYTPDTVNQPNFSVDADCQPFTGNNKLESVALKGKDGTSVLTTRTFSYAPQHHSFDDDPELLPITDDKWGYDWPHLVSATNGIGGLVTYSYTQQGNGCACWHWTHAAVTTETMSAGAGQPDVVTTYAYTGPYQWNWPNPNQPSTVDEFNAENRGYSQVIETDAAGTRTIHSYHVPTLSWNDDVLHGREYNTRVEDGTASRWSEVGTTWAIRSVANYDAVNERYYANFVYPASSATTLRDGTVMTENNIFDDGAACAPPAAACYGLLTRKDNLGVTGVGDDVSTKTAYHKDLSAWIFKARFEEVVDPAAGDAMLACSKSYYDGAQFTTTPPSRGLLTATSTAIAGTVAQCEGAAAFTTSTNGYMVYDAYGNVVQTSVPDALAPENVASPGGASGWVPDGVPYATNLFDTAHRVYLMQSSAPPVNGVTQTTNYNVDGNTFDFRLGKPTKVSMPNGNTINYRYDAFGRLEKYWDALDSEATPSAAFYYNWGTPGQLNQTLTTTLVDVGPPRWRYDQSCVDGVGREVESWSHYNGASLGVVRTDYNLVGQTAVVTEAFDGGEALPLTGCDTSLPAVTDQNRTAFGYDPLGNVTTTYFLEAGPAPDPLACTAPGGTPPCTQVSIDGLTTSAIDENGHRTVRTSDPLNRRSTVEEDTGTDPWTPYATTTYQYDALSHLVGITDTLGNQTSLGYDMAGRKTSMTDPDMGGPSKAWIYEYDAAGRLTTQTDAHAAPFAVPIITTLAYDALGRPTSKSYSNDDPPVSWSYDVYPDTGWCTADPQTAVGLQTQMTDGSGDERTCYDGRGRAAKMRRTVDSLPPYEMETTYDRLDQPVQVTYPSVNGQRDVITYTDSGTGNVTGLSSDVDGAGALPSDTLLSNSVPKPWGAPATLPLGNGLTTSYDYDFRQRVRSIATGTVQNFTLTYDNASNITSVADTADTVGYTYDDLDRLTDATGFADGASAHYTYDQIGNLLTKQEGSASLSNLGLCYPASGPLSVRPHAVTSVYSAPSGTTPGCGVGTQWATFTYDDDGNMLGGGNNTANGQRGGHAFDGENRLSEVIDSPPWSPGLQGFGCVDLAHGNDSIGYQISASMAQLIFSAATAGMKVGKPGYDPEMDLDQNGVVSNGDAQREFNWFKSEARCPKQAARYRYDANGTLLKRMSPGGRVPSPLVRDPGLKGYYGDWIATPPTNPADEHFRNLNDTDDGTYVEQSTASTYETFKVASFGIPDGAIVESVTFNFRWEAVGATTGTLIPVYRQDSVDAAGASRSLTPAQGWLNDKWLLTYNPKTGNYWTAADLNAGVEFGFQTGPNAGETPRVAKASVSTVYRNPASASTIYIGGVFEENRDGTGAVVDTTKYYSARGRTIAIRKTGAAGGQGTLYWPLHDHLGTTTGVTDGAGALVSSQRYWPFGGTRTGGITQTDKLYTGQQQETGDAGLGLYNYRARFYSTTLGRFLSVDPIGGSEGDPQSWNPYAYVGNNPLVYVDPTGMYKGEKWINKGKKAAGELIGVGGDAAGAVGDAYNWVNGTLTSAAQNIDSGDVHTVLDVVGMAPVVGEAADVANAALYAYEGHWVNAGLSLGSAIPIGGNGFTAARWGLRYGDEGFALAGFVGKHEDEAASAIGIVYRRTDLSGGIKPYVGKAKSEARYIERQREHARWNRSAAFKFEILGRAPVGVQLDRLEEYHIRKAGGPSGRYNPSGPLSNWRHAMSDEVYEAAGGDFPP